MRRQSFLRTGGAPLKLSLMRAGCQSLAVKADAMVEHDFKAGDQVVHWSYGPGKVVQLEEKEMSGQKLLYYVVQIRDLTLWVPVGEAGQSSLRMVTPAKKFDKLYDILRSPGEPLASDRMERKAQLSERMKIGQLEAICRVIRDLMLFKQTQRMSETDNNIYRRAQSFLLDEWTLSLPVSLPQAGDTLQQLLGESLANSNIQA
jgi:CarD family transcriptional regulator